MRFTIETIENGCKEVLDFGNGTVLERTVEKTEYGCKGTKDFYTLLDEQNYCPEIKEKVDELFGGFFDLNFLDLVDLLKCMRII